MFLEGGYIEIYKTQEEWYNEYDLLFEPHGNLLKISFLPWKEMETKTDDELAGALRERFPVFAPEAVRGFVEEACEIPKRAKPLFQKIEEVASLLGNILAECKGGLF